MRVAERLEQRHRLHDLAVDLGRRTPGSLSELSHGVRARRRVGERGAESVRDCGVKRVRGGATRRCGRALGGPPG